MDPVTIATGVVAILAPYLKEGGEAMVRTAGEVGLQKARQLLDLLKRRWSEDPEAAKTLERFEKNPEGYQAPLQDLLNERLAADPELTGILNEQVREIAPRLNVNIDVDEAGNVTGIDAGEIRRAVVDVVIRARKVERDVTGVRADVV
jgi:hypothetical protein